MSKYTSDSYVWHINFYGDYYQYSTSTGCSVRPAITVKSDLEINGGNGTWNNPYEI